MNLYTATARWLRRMQILVLTGFRETEKCKNPGCINTSCVMSVTLLSLSWDVFNKFSSRPNTSVCLHCASVHIFPPYNARHDEWDSALCRGLSCQVHLQCHIPQQLCTIIIRITYSQTENRRVTDRFMVLFNHVDCSFQMSLKERRCFVMLLCWRTFFKHLISI